MRRRFSKFCPACGRVNPADIMLCLDCWFQLPSYTRELLSLKDRFFADRYAFLIRHLLAGTPAFNIIIPSFHNLSGSLDNIDVEQFLEDIRSDESHQLTLWS